MIQGAPEWHAAKLRRIGGTAARVIMQCDPWVSEFELWETLTGRRAVIPNPAMRRGQQLEGDALAAYQAAHSVVMRPAFLVHPAHDWAVASLDGVTFEGDGLVELKCPGRPQHEAHVRDGIPEHYHVQVQHYLWVSGAAWCDFVSYHPEGAPILHVVRVLPDAAFHAVLCEREKAWWRRHLLADEPPPKGPRDLHVREDAAWLTAAACYREAEAVCAEWAGKKDAARELLLSLMGEGLRSTGGGVTVTPYTQEGTLDWKPLVAAAKAAGVDIEQFRKAAQTIVRVTVAKR